MIFFFSKTFFALSSENEMLTELDCRMNNSTFYSAGVIDTQRKLVKSVVRDLELLLFDVIFYDEKEKVVPSLICKTLKIYI